MMDSIRLWCPSTSTCVSKILVAFCMSSQILVTEMSFLVANNVSLIHVNNCYSLEILCQSGFQRGFALSQGCMGIGSVSLYLQSSCQ